MENLYCTNELRTLIKGNLDTFERKQLEPQHHRRAAVAVVIADYRGLGGMTGFERAEADSAALLLTRRAGNLSSHAGQWALPGGSLDDGERPVQAALRELSEEVGLHLSADQVLGCLDDFVTRSGFHIVPVVIWAGEVERLQRNSQEVAAIHRIPCTEFFRPEAPLIEKTGGKNREILYMPVGDTFIATPTAAILFQFREVALCGNATRVAHYEQPLFAWQ